MTQASKPTLARGLLGHGALYTLATVAPIVVLLFVTPLVTRALGAEEYGGVAVAISIYQLASVALAVGLPLMITRDALLAEEGFHRATGYVAFGAALGVAMGAVVAASVAIWSPLLFPGVSPLVVAMGVTAGAGLAVVSLGQAVLRAAGRVGAFVGVAMVAALLPPATGLVVVYGGIPTASAYSQGLAAGYAVAAILAVAVALRHARPQLSWARSWEAVRIGLPSVPHSLAVPALLTIVMATVVRLDGVAEGGQLQVAVMLGSAVVTVLNAVNNAWAPMVMTANEPDRPALLSRSSLFVAIVALALVSGYVMVAPIALPLIGGPVVAGDLPVRASAIVAMSGAFHVAYLANIHLTFISKRTWPLALTTPLSGVLAVGIGVALGIWIDGDTALFAYAAVWPLFYLFQSIASYFLARTSRFQPAQLGWGLIVLAVAACVALQAAIIRPQPAWSCIFVAGLTAIGGLVFWLTRRARGRSAT